MSAEGSKRAIIAALLANAGIATAKFIGFLITGSSSMIAEAVHSVADTSNQGLLLFGQNRAAKQANRLHPFGYGRSRYFYSFVVALVLFTLGSMFAIYEGIEKIRHADDHGLGIADRGRGDPGGRDCPEGYSFRTAYKESAAAHGRGHLVAVHPQRTHPRVARRAAGGHRCASSAWSWRSAVSA